MVLFKEDNIVIEHMTEDDLHAVMEIEREAFSDPWTFDMFYAEFFNPVSNLWVLRKASGGVIGYICFWRVEDEVHIMNLAVHRDYRRRGYASAILRSAIDHWKSEAVGKAFLEVRRSNNAAYEIYRKFGFEMIVTRKRYYKNPVEDAVVMELRII